MNLQMFFGEMRGIFREKYIRTYDIICFNSKQIKSTSILQQAKILKIRSNTDIITNIKIS